MANHAIFKIVPQPDRHGKIIQSLRSFSRDVGNDPFEKTNLRSLVVDTLSFCDQRFLFSDVEIAMVDIPDSLQVECRSVQIQQVILNLLNNAFDAISEHKTKKWIQIKAWQKNQMIYLTVIDSGTGIPAELREKIMQPFFTTKDIGKGTGLGLSVSIGIIESHNGTLSLNEHCQNTCFQISIPITQSNERDPRE